jgi:hypothetical protein
VLDQHGAISPASGEGAGPDIGKADTGSEPPR